MDSLIQERYYRCYFISNDHVVGYENVFSHDDVGAIEKLRKILAATEHLSVELWRGNKCVSKLDKIDAGAEVGKLDTWPSVWTGHKKSWGK